MTAESTVPTLECRGLSVRYDAVSVLSTVDLSVGPGQVLALLGPSGSGKSTLLHTVAGFVPPDAGQILLGGHLVASPRHTEPPERRAIGMVFQNYALWPHLSVLDTVAYPLRRAGLSRRMAREQAEVMLCRLRLVALADRRPGQLSGGEQQRVGLARALARRGRLNLFDEPTAHLDAALRAVVQAEIVDVLRGTDAATVYTTHDAAEALAVADRVALLRDGRLIQQGTPVEIYEQPVDLWAAHLTGPASRLRASLTPQGPDRAVADLAGTALDIRVPHASAGVGHLLVRPGWATLGGPLPGTVVAARYRGGRTDYTLDTPAGRLELSDSSPLRLHTGEHATWTLHRAWIIAPESALMTSDDPAVAEP